MYIENEKPISQGMKNLSIFKCSPNLTSMKKRSRTLLRDVYNGKYQNLFMRLFFNLLIFHMLNSLLPPNPSHLNYAKLAHFPPIYTLLSNNIVFSLVEG